MTLDRTKLARVLGLLGSGFDGEILAAARQAERLRREAGLSWPQILGSASDPTEDPVTSMIEELVENIRILNPWVKHSCSPSQRAT